MHFINKTIKISKIILFFSLILMGFSKWMKNGLPNPQDIHPYLLQVPSQVKTQTEPFSKIINQQAYDIKPLYNYHLKGLVVSERNFNESWVDWIKFKQDPMNIKDLCVLWGANLVREDYKKIKFSSGEFTCYAQVPPGIFLYNDALSNNHLISADPNIAMILGQMRRGDQVEIKGSLVQYHNLTTGLKRGTSVNRNDTGNGACETIFVNEAKILKNGNIIWELTELFALTASILSLICIIYCWIVGTK